MGVHDKNLLLFGFFFFLNKRTMGDIRHNTEIIFW